MDTGILSISLLAAWSLIYFIVKSFFDSDIYKTDKETGNVLRDNDGNKIIKFSKNAIQNVLLIIYIVILFFFQIMASIFGYNSMVQDNTKKVEDELNTTLPTPDTSQKLPEILLSTLLPWTIMFVSLVALLKVFPGWKLPFSNTFGYLVVKLLGISGIMNKLIISYDELGNSDEAETKDENFNRAIRTMKPIISNPTLIINEMSTENFDNAWNILENGKILKDEEFFNATYQPQKITRESTRSTLQQYISIKENVAEFIWYILAGAFIASYVQNLIVNIGPPISDEQLKQEYTASIEKTNNEELGKTYVDEE